MQAHLKKHAPHEVFIHCHYHNFKLQLAYVQSANSNSPKRCQYLKEIQKVYLVSALENIYLESHEPEALGINKLLSKPSTLFAIYLLEYILPQVSKLSKTLQKENLDLSIISSLVDATLHTLEDVLLPVANWVLDLLDVKD